MGRGVFCFRQEGLSGDRNKMSRNTGSSRWPRHGRGCRLPTRGVANELFFSEEHALLLRLIDAEVAKWEFVPALPLPS